MSTCDWLDLETLGSQLIMPKNLPTHWEVHCSSLFYFCPKEPKKSGICDEIWVSVNVSCADFFGDSTSIEEFGQGES